MTGEELIKKLKGELDIIQQELGANRLSNVEFNMREFDYILYWLWYSDYSRRYICDLVCKPTKKRYGWSKGQFEENAIRFASREAAIKFQKKWDLGDAKIGTIRTLPKAEATRQSKR